MVHCKHTCSDCGEKWNCDFPYFSNHESFAEAVTVGAYCNAYCPVCNPEKRLKLDELFDETPKLQENVEDFYEEQKETDSDSYTPEFSS